jgi:hypothetical protein
METIRSVSGNMPHADTLPQAVQPAANYAIA